MKAHFIYAGLLCFVAAPYAVQAAGASFCVGSKFIPLDVVLSKPGQFLNRRIQTHAILKTNERDVVRISPDEQSKASILVTADHQSNAYYERHKFLSHRPKLSSSHLYLSSSHPLSALGEYAIGDYRERLRARFGAVDKPDMTRMQYYRQDVMVCGRLIMFARDLRFAVDDVRIEKSYLLPDKP